MDLVNLPARVAQQATLSTHIHFKRITWNHEALQQQHAGTIADQAVTFHLSQTETSIPGATFCRLPEGQTETTTTRSGAGNLLHLSTLMTPQLQKHWLSSKKSIICMSWLPLPGENSSGTSGSGVHFIKDHVLQFLVVHRTEVDVSFQRLPEETRATKHGALLNH